jgi:DNA repair protein RadD
VIQLRPYQTRALAEVQNAYRSGRRAPLLCSPTGSGKSAMVGYMLSRTKKRTLILAHRLELVEMISEALPVPHGLITAGKGTSPDQVQVGMMQTVARRLRDLPPFDWVISDEAHLAVCPTWLGILKHYSAAWHLGMSASPCRLDGKGLGEHFDTIVHGPSIRELTDRGFLVPCRVFAPPVEFGAVKKSGGDFNMEDAARALDKAAITGSAVAHLRKLGRGRRAIVFCCNRAHADHVAAEFRAGGFSAVNVDGAMTPADRRHRIAEFRAGRVEVLVNVELLTTGFDCPEIDVGIFLRPTQSLALYLQMVGRILRIFPGKRQAILLDHVGNVLRHGMPDEAREWTLDGRLKRTTPPPVRMCPSCYAAFAPAPRCPSCGYVFAAAAKPRQIEQRAGELVELRPGDGAASKAAELQALLKSAKTRADLEAIARSRGYKPNWVNIQLGLRARHRSRAA